MVTGSSGSSSGRHDSGGSYCSTSAWMRHLRRTLASCGKLIFVIQNKPVGVQTALAGFLMDESKTKGIPYPLTAAALHGRIPVVSHSAGA